MIGSDPRQANDRGPAVYRPSGWTWPITHHHLNTMRGVLDKARAGDLTPDWRDTLTTPTPPGPADADAAAQVIEDLRGLPPQAWEPHTARGDWRTALDCWYRDRREILDAASDLNDHTRRSQRSGLRRIRAATLTTDLKLRNAMLDELDSGDTTLDALAVMHDTLERAERDHIAAWYRAGLAAGGEPNDWVRWYTQRLQHWPNPDAAQSRLNALSDPGHLARFEALPRYWR